METSIRQIELIIEGTKNRIEKNMKLGNYKFAEMDSEYLDGLQKALSIIKEGIENDAK